MQNSRGGRGVAQAGATINERILGLLVEAPTPLDDDEIAARLGVARQQVNQRCRHLERSGLIVREHGAAKKIVNRRSRPVARDVPAVSVPPAPHEVTGHPDVPSDWFWEGHIQGRLRDHLVARGWQLLRESDCLSRERGIDLLLERGGEKLAVEVKGFPSTTYRRGPMKGQPKPTQPTLQAKHWFAEALLAAILVQSKHPTYAVAIAFPNIRRYRCLIDSTRNALTRVGLGVFLVEDGGAVDPVLPCVPCRSADANA